MPLGTLPPAGQALWEDVYDSSLQFYGDKKIAARVAWTVVKSKYEKRGRRWARRVKGNPSAPRVLPDPGATTQLGRILALEVLDADGTLYSHTFSDRRSAPLLFWDEEKKALLALPGVQLRKVSRRLASELAGKKTARKAANNAYKWNWRCVSGARAGKVAPTPLRLQGTAVRIVYDSDKGHKGTFKPWQHPFGPGVRAYVSRGAPPVIYIRGGRLTLTTRGLVH